MPAKRIKQQRLPSRGTLTLIEDQGGELIVRLDVDEQEGTDENLLKRIKAALAGLAYHYEHNPDATDVIGLAFLDGMDVGGRAVRAQVPPPPPQGHKKQKKIKSQYAGSKIGYGAKV